MNETVILVALIIGFFAVTIVALVGAIFVRKREQGQAQERNAADVMNQVDAALDTAVTEINKMGSLIQKEMTEKYQAMLFLYNLLEDKQKEMTGGTVASVKKATVSNTVEARPVAVATEMESPPRVRKMEPTRETAAPKRETKKPPAAVKTDKADNYLETLAERTADAPVVAVAAPLAPPTPPRFTNPKHEDIWLRHQAGQSLADIARDLGMGQGEVKLIIDITARG